MGQTIAQHYSLPVSHIKYNLTAVTIEATTQGKPVEIKFGKQGEENIEPTVFALRDFMDCILDNKTPASNVLSARDTSIAIHMGNAAADLQQLQVWKPEYSL